MIKSKKYGVIDIGSNSVRAILYSDGKILYKSLITSRLGEGLYSTGNICPTAFTRSVEAIKTLNCKLLEIGASQVFAFATEAVRSAKNGKLFIDAVKSETGLTVDVVDGDEEGNHAAAEDGIKQLGGNKALVP